MGEETAHQDGVGEPDELDRLWTPYRMAYIRGENKPARRRRRGSARSAGSRGSTTPTGLVVRRGELAYVVLNLYPYAPGHLMVCPYRHIADYTETTDEEAAEIADLTRDGDAAVRAVSGAEGFNIGMNQGASPAPASPPTCTSTSCRAGRATRTSCPSSAAPGRCPSCSGTPARCSPTPGRSADPA